MSLSDYKSGISSLFAEAALSLSDEEFETLIDELHEEGWGF